MALSDQDIRSKLLEMGVDQRILDNVQDSIQLRAVYSHERMHRMYQRRMVVDKAIDAAVEEFRAGEIQVQDETGLPTEHLYQVLLGTCGDN